MVPVCAFEVFSFVIFLIKQNGYHNHIIEDIDKSKYNIKI